MPEEKRDFGPALVIAADALGEPGQRTFRLLVRNDRASAVLWLEKEQLHALAMATDELLAQVGTEREQAEEPEIPNVALDFPARFDVDLKVGQLSIGYDEEGSHFLLLAHSVDDDPEEQATFRCLISRRQLAGLGRQAHEIVAAGRPRCVLCASPLEPAPHFCPPSNGHGQGKIE